MWDGTQDMDKYHMYCTNGPNGTVIMQVPMLIFEGKL